MILLAGGVLAACFFVNPSQAGEPSTADVRAKLFIAQYEATVRPLEIEAAKAMWAASLTGKEEDFKRKEEAETQMDLCVSDPEKFAELKAIRKAGVTDPLLARQIEILYLRYLGKQIDHDLLKAMAAKDNAAQRAFNVCRPVVNGKEMTDNDIREILRKSTDSAERKAAWEAGKKVGSMVVKDLLALVAMRNQAARKLGFANYHVMQLQLAEQDQAEILKLFDALDELTREPYRAAKAEFDAVLAQRCGISIEELRPWHYHDPFFQEAPITFAGLPEAVYKPLDSVKISHAFYNGIGLSVDSVLAHSDLYEKPGKNPHAFCIDLDRAGDVRVLCNVVPGREWLSTMLHELGHAVYSENVGASLPYVLHAEAHIFCTEGVAMMFERFTNDADWLQAFGAEIPDPAAFRAASAKLQRNRLLVFSRYCQVMFRFEKALYEKAETLENPERDLGRIWWDLVEKYQEMKRPEGRDEPDFASKYHLVGAPAYYHNYLLGEMFASQTLHALKRDVLPKDAPSAKSPSSKSPMAASIGNAAVGQWMRAHIFEPGMTLDWNALTRHATGEPLSPKAFAEDISSQ
jgi:peptidyl-dipeptidase A